MNLNKFIFYDYIFSLTISYEKIYQFSLKYNIF